MGNEPIVKLLPLIPYKIGDEVSYLPPNHPLVRHRPEAKEAQKEYDKYAGFAEDF